MGTAHQGQQPSPALFFETINSYQKTASLKAATELEVFTAVGEDNTTAQDLARRCRTSERGMRILCDYLTVIGFLTKKENRYGLTPDSAMFLDRRSQAYLGTAVNFLTSSSLTDGFKDLASAVRRGGTPTSEKGSMAPQPPMSP